MTAPPGDSPDREEERPLWGHEERFPPPRLSGRYRFGQATFAGASGNDEDPKAAIPLEPAKPLSSTPCRHVHRISAPLNSLELTDTSDGLRDSLNFARDHRNKRR